MRDWNDSSVHKYLVAKAAFRAYLWGIEIMAVREVFTPAIADLELTYEGLKSKFSLTSTLLSSSFRAYLWGIEISKMWNNQIAPRTFRAYLWGIEIDRVDSLDAALPGFRAYLWGIEMDPGDVIEVIHDGI